MTETKLCTAFDGHEVLAAGPLPDIAVAVRAAQDRGAAGPLLVFDDSTGRVVDLDLRGTDAEIVARLGEPRGRGRGRPKLGVVAREVTMLPRQWEWLQAQPGGASVTLRRLVEQAQRSGEGRRRTAQETAYRVMVALGGDLAGFEDATRALFAADRDGFSGAVAGWPEGIRAYAGRLAAEVWPEKG